MQHKNMSPHSSILFNSRKLYHKHLRPNRISLNAKQYLPTERKTRRSFTGWFRNVMQFLHYCAIYSICPTLLASGSLRSLYLFTLLRLGWGRWGEGLFSSCMICRSHCSLTLCPLSSLCVCVCVCNFSTFASQNLQNDQEKEQKRKKKKKSTQYGEKKSAGIKHGVKWKQED